MVAALSEKLSDCFAIAEVKQAQNGDPFCRALQAYLQSNGESLPTERALARRVVRLALSCVCAQRRLSDQSGKDKASNVG